MRAILKRCPFCGGLATARKGLNVFVDCEIQCRKCSASGGCFNDYDKYDLNYDAAAKHWNERKEAINDR